MWVVLEMSFKSEEDWKKLAAVYGPNVQTYPLHLFKTEQLFVTTQRTGLRSFFDRARCIVCPILLTFSTVRIRI